MSWADHSTPPQTIPVELTLSSGPLELSAFKTSESSSYVSDPSRDTVTIGGQTLTGWEFSEFPPSLHISSSELTAAMQQNIRAPEFGGRLQLGSQNSTTSVAWGLGKIIQDHTISLSISNSSGTLQMGGSNVSMDWWNPTEATFGAWSFVIDGVAVDGKLIEPLIPGTVNASKRQNSQDSPASAPAVEPTAPASTPGAGPSDNCIACTLEYKICSCREDETCVRHPMSCQQCEWLECIKNKTDTGGTDCIACPEIYKACDCARDEECARTPQSCKACETVECRKRGSGTNPTTPNPSPNPTPSPTEPELPAGNCSTPLACPAIYQLCGCRADETCHRKSRCDKCEWLECHKPPIGVGNGTCVVCPDPEPECNCKLGSVCVRTPRSCGSCGSATCRSNGDNGVRIALSLDDEIGVSPDFAKAIFAHVPGVAVIGDPPTVTRRPTASVVTLTATTRDPSSTPIPPNSPQVSSVPGSAGTASSSGTSSSAPVAPPVPQGKTYFSIPCNTTAVITLMFPGVNYTLTPADWVITRHDGCRALIVAQDTMFSDIVVGRPFLRTVETAFRFDPTGAKVGFARVNGTVGGVNAVQGQKPAGAAKVGVSAMGVLAAVAFALAL